MNKLIKRKLHCYESNKWESEPFYQPDQEFLHIVRIALSDTAISTNDTAHCMLADKDI